MPLGQVGNSGVEGADQMPDAVVGPARPSRGLAEVGLECQSDDLGPLALSAAGRGRERLG